MIIRIVKMQFRVERTDDFIRIFKKNKAHIRSFEGCSHLHLLRDKNDPRIFFTYSHWKDEMALNKYRKSDLFKEVWAETKALFSGKPEAWSTAMIENTPSGK